MLKIIEISPFKKEMFNKLQYNWENVSSWKPEGLLTDLFDI